LKYLRAVAPAGQPISLSNASICAGVGYGSEGEVSQILRWLAGELPMTGRWAHRYLDTPQQLRYLRRERRPDGGYLTTVLAAPEPIVLAAVSDDPVHDPANQAFPRAPQGIMDHDPLTVAPQSAPPCPTETAARDHARESESNHAAQQERAPIQNDSAVAESLLYQCLIANPHMSRPLAQRIAANPVGTRDDFERDLALAHDLDSITQPFWFTVSRWRDGQRVLAKEAHDDRRPAERSSARRAAQSRRCGHGHDGGGGAAVSRSVDPAIYAQILANARPLDLDDALWL
jgi:hypothetical protein